MAAAAAQRTTVNDAVWRNQFQAVCAKCLQTAEKLDACGRCHVTKYCGRADQSADWPAHKLVCEEKAKHLHVSSILDIVNNMLKPSGVSIIQDFLEGHQAAACRGQSAYLQLTFVDGVFSEASTEIAEDLPKDPKADLSEKMKRTLLHLRKTAISTRDRELYCILARPNKEDSVDAKNFAAYVATRITSPKVDPKIASGSTARAAKEIPSTSLEAQCRSLIAENFKLMFNLGIDPDLEYSYLNSGARSLEEFADLYAARPAAAAPKEKKKNSPDK